MSERDSLFSALDLERRAKVAPTKRNERPKTGTDCHVVKGQVWQSAPSDIGTRRRVTVIHATPSTVIVQHGRKELRIPRHLFGRAEGYTLLRDAP